MIRRSSQLIAALAAVSMAVGCGPSAGGSPQPTIESSPTASTPTTSPTATPRLRPTSAIETPPPITYLPPIATNPLDATTAANLQHALDELVAAGSPDAIASVVTADGQWSGAAGIDGPDDRLAGPDDEFNIASVSKAILAALVLRLVQDGEMDLDAPVADYLGDLAVDANGATVRQALGMRSGIGDTSVSMQAEARADCANVWSRTEVLRSIPAPTRPPGEAFAYSNPTYKILGYAVEHVTGTSLEEAFRDRMFAPLGLDRILLQGPERATPKPWALPVPGHAGGLDLEAFGIGGTLPCVSISTFSFATSAAASDAPSLARWGWGLFSGTLLDVNGLTAMATVDPSGNGLGISRSSTFLPDLAYGVHGSQVGYSAFLAILPVRQIVVAVFVNDSEADVERAARRLVNALGT